MGLTIVFWGLGALAQGRVYYVLGWWCAHTKPAVVNTTPTLFSRPPTHPPTSPLPRPPHLISPHLTHPTPPTYIPSSRPALAPPPCTIAPGDALSSYLTCMDRPPPADIGNDDYCVPLYLRLHFVNLMRVTPPPSLPLPPQDRYLGEQLAMPAFATVLRRIAALWRTNRREMRDKVRAGVG